MPDLLERFEKAAKDISYEKKDVRKCVYCAYVDHLSEIDTDDLPPEIRIIYESVKMQLTSTIPPGEINADEASWIAEDILYMADVVRSRLKNLKREKLKALGYPIMGNTLKELGVEIIIEKDYIVIKPPEGISFWDIYMALGNLVPTSEFQDKNDIWVFREGPVDIALPDLEKIKKIGNKFCPKNAKGKKTAIIVATGFQRGLAEVYIKIGGEHSRRIRVFSDFKSAEHWITDN